MAHEAVGSQNAYRGRAPDKRVEQSGPEGMMNYGASWAGHLIVARSDRWEVVMEKYEALSGDADCCAALGRTTLAAARLESDLRVFLALNGVNVGATATLGGLVQKLREHGLLSGNGHDIMRTLKRQRNYLTHSLYDLFAARIDEDLMSREELADVSLLAGRAWMLEEDLNGLSIPRIGSVDGQHGGTPLRTGSCAPGTRPVCARQGAPACRRATGSPTARGTRDQR